MNIKNKLNPNWITGFVDGDGCFTVSIIEDKRSKLGWQIYTRFSIELHVKDKELLERIKIFFQVGTIWTDHKSVLYQVSSKRDIIDKILPHFNKYPLITKKQADFLLFKNILKIIDKKEHLTREGLIKIVNLKASLNLGLSIKLKINFKDNIKLIKRPEVFLPKNIDFNWFAGFFSAEGCFFIQLKKIKASRLIHSVGLSIYIGQHIKDKLLINKFIEFLGCGKIRNSKNFVEFYVNSFKDINYILIPLFNKYNIEGEKLLNFKDFCLVAELINKKAHLRSEELEQIKIIKFRMNRGRYLE